MTAPTQVIGGGFAGLSAAYFLARAGRSVRVVESAERTGGLLRTLSTPYGMVETAANAFLSNGLLERTAGEIGVKLLPTLPSARRRYIYRDGRPRRFPLHAVAATRFFADTIPRFLLARKGFAPAPGETILAWGQKNLGREATEYLLVPALSGVYAGDPGALSASLILGRFLGLSPGPRVPRGKLRGSVAPLGGMEEFTRGLRRALERAGAEFSAEPAEGLRTIVALPPPAAAVFLRGRAPALATSLARIEMNSLVSVTVFLPAAAPGLAGFGCLFPRSQGFRVLGVLANDQIFPGRARAGYRSETWIFGGATDPQATELSDHSFENLIAQERTRLFDEAPIEHLVVSRWPRAIPHYSVGLEEELANLRARKFNESDYTLFGTYQGDLGLARLLVRAEALTKDFP